MKKCIDVSSYQGKIDWKKVKESRVEHAIIRTTLKNGTNDSYCIRNITGASVNNISHDLYKYTYATNSSSAIDECVKLSEMIFENNLIDFGVLWVDLETPNLWGGNPKETTKIIYDTYKEFFATYGVKVGLYTCKSYYDNCFDQNYFTNEKLWLARYPHTGVCDLDSYDIQYRPYDCNIWQFSSSGVVKGITGYVDLNVIFDDNTDKKEYYKIPTWTLVTALESIGVNSSYGNRQKIANINNILNYTGSYEQNTLMLKMLLGGVLLCK